MKKMTLLNVSVEKLKPYQANPRQNDTAVEAVAKSLKRYGFIKNSIVVDENLELITGHTTLKAMQSLGWTEVPEITQVEGLTEDEKRGYRIADNKTGELAQWDLDLLSDEFKRYEIEGFDVGDIEDYTGFDSQEILDIITQNHHTEEDINEKEYDENLETENECPKCGYKW